MSVENSQNTETPKGPVTAGNYVYFNAEEYIGLMPRIGILLVDTVSIVVLYIVASVATSSFLVLSEETMFAVLLLTAWFYLTVIKVSPFRTIGYRLFGARIVNLKGQTPSIVRMTFRFLLCLFGPFSFIFDLLWVSSDEQRQTLRDRFAGTCVVRAQAEPAGDGECISLTSTPWVSI